MSLSAFRLYSYKHALCSLYIYCTTLLDSFFFVLLQTRSHISQSTSSVKGFLINLLINTQFPLHHFISYGFLTVIQWPYGHLILLPTCEWQLEININLSAHNLLIQFAISRDCERRNKSILSFTVIKTTPKFKFEHFIPL